MSGGLPPMTPQAIETMRRMGVDVELLFNNSIRNRNTNGGNADGVRDGAAVGYVPAGAPVGVQGYTPTFGGISGYDPGPSGMSNGNNGPRAFDYNQTSAGNLRTTSSPLSNDGSFPTNYTSSPISPQTVYFPQSTYQGYQAFPSPIPPLRYNTSSTSSPNPLTTPDTTYHSELPIVNGDGDPSSRVPGYLAPSSQPRTAPSKREEPSTDVRVASGSKPYAYGTNASGTMGNNVKKSAAGKKALEQDKEHGISEAGAAADGVGAGGDGKTSLGPVKNACLSCRAKKARCDGGQPICSQCVLKERECVYVKSKRGGARKRREKPPPEAPAALADFLQQLDHVMMLQPPPKGIEGLSLNGGNKTDFDHVPKVQKLDENDVKEILRFYWSELHPLHPLLPPVQHIDLIASRLTADSPLLLAIRCILALIPNSDTPEATSQAAKSVRRSAASTLADKAARRVQEVIASAREAGRKPSIECAQASSLLGLYEFGQTNDAAKNWERMSQALELAIELGLHQIDNAAPFEDAAPSQSTDIAVDDHAEVFREMGRRTFWVIYVATMLAGMLAIKAPALRPRDKRITSKLPKCRSQSPVWFEWIEGMCLNMDCAGVILSLDYGMPFDDNNTLMDAEYDPGFETECIGYTEEERASALLKKHLNKKLVETDARVLTALAKAEGQEITPLTADGEQEVSRNLQLVTLMLLAACQVQIHRRQAFPEVALFGREMCGLPQPPDLLKSQLGEAQSPQSALSSTDRASPSINGVSSSNGEVISSPAIGAVMGYDPPPMPGALNGYNPPDAFPSSMNGVAEGYPASAPSFGDIAPDSLPMAGLLWDPTIHPETFPTPWFANTAGAGAFYQPLMQSPAYLPPVDGLYTNKNGWLGAPLEATSPLMGWNPTESFPANNGGTFGGVGTGQQGTLAPALGYDSSALQPQGEVNPDAWSADALAAYRLPPAEPLPLWGADMLNVQTFFEPATSNDFVDYLEDGFDADGVEEVRPGTSGSASVPVSTIPDGPFPPGLSLQRCATAAHSIVRLQVLHRSAKITMTQYPRLVPWCSCALVSGAYSFLLLCLAIQASHTFDATDKESEGRREIEAMWNNVQVILGGLEAYGQVWDGIDMMAAEVKAALQAARQLPQDLARSVRSNSGSTLR